MRAIQIICTLAIVFLSQSALAQGQGNGNGAPPGDVNVVNTPDVNVINSPDVNVANVPDVVVANTQASPIPVTDQGGGPQPSIYREQLVLTVPVGASNFSNTFNVGASTPGHIRVVEHISVFVPLSAATNVTFFTCTLRDASSTDIVTIPLIIERQPNNQTSTIANVGNQSIRLYVNNSDRLACAISLDAFVTASRDTLISLVGYDVDPARDSLSP